MVVAIPNHISPAAAISGFTSLYDQFGPSGMSTFGQILFKVDVVAASEPANYTLTGGSTFDGFIGRVPAGTYDLTQPFGTPVGSATGTSTGGTTVTSSAYTPGVNDELLLHVAALWDNPVSSSGTSGYTYAISRVEGDPMAVEYKALVGQSGISQPGASMTRAGTDNRAATISVGIRPAASGPTSHVVTAAGTGQTGGGVAIHRIRTDLFNRSNELLTAGPDWLGFTGDPSLRVASNMVKSQGTNGGNVYNISLTSDQWAQAQCIIDPGGYGTPTLEVMVRATADGQQCYEGGWSTNGGPHYEIYKNSGGSYSLMGSTVPTADGLDEGSKLIKIEAIGNVINLYADGVLVITRTDSSSPLTGGSPGLWGYIDAIADPNAGFDNFTAGGESAGASLAITSAGTGQSGGSAAIDFEGLIPATFIAAGALSANASGTTITAALPAGWAPGDVCVAVFTANASETFSTPTGWTLLGSTISNANFSMATFIKRLVTSEPNPATTVGTTMSTTIGGYGRTYAWRGVGGNATPAVGVVNNGTPTTSTTPSSLAVATSASQQRVVAIVGIDDDNTWSSGMPPAGWTNIGGILSSTTGGDGAIDAITALAATATTVAAATFGTMSGADYWRTVAFALVAGTYKMASAGTGQTGGSAAMTVAAGGTSYAITAGGTGTSAGSAAISISVGAPAAPTALRPSDAFGYSSTVELDWSDSAGATAYTVAYSDDFGATWTNHVGAITTSTVDLTELDDDVRYDFRVRATNSGGDSAWTYSEWGSTPVAATAPLTPPSSSTQSSPAWELDLDDGTDDGTYAYRYTGAGVRIYDIGPGVRITHNEFTGRVGTGFTVGDLLWEQDLYQQFGLPNGDHDTACASKALGTTCGIAKGATLIPIQNFKSTTTGGWSGTVPNIEDIESYCAWIVANHPDGTPGVVTSSQLFDLHFNTSIQVRTDAAIQSVIDIGIAWVQCEGNEFQHPRQFGPTEYPGLIYVGGLDDDGISYWDDSNSGATTDVIAGANGITCAGGDSDSALYSNWHGTSFATPQVAGTLALWLEANPALTPAQLQDMVRASSIKDVITGVPAGTPNRRLHTLADIPPPPTTGLSVSAAGAGASTGAAALRMTQAAATAGTGQTAGAAALTARLTVSAAGTGQSAGGVNIGRAHPVTSAGSGQTAGAGTFAPIRMTASGTGQSGGSAALVSTLVASSAGTGASAGSAAISRGLPLNSAGSATFTGAAAITISNGPVSHNLIGNGLGQSGGSAALIFNPAVMSAAGTGQTAGAATFGARLPFAAGGTGTSGGIATIARSMPLVAPGTGQSTGQARFGPLAMSGSGSGSFTGAAPIALARPHPMAAAGTGTSTGSANIQVGSAASMAASGTGATGGHASILLLKTFTDLNVTVGGLLVDNQFTIAAMTVDPPMSVASFLTPTLVGATSTPWLVAGLAASPPVTVAAMLGSTADVEDIASDPPFTVGGFSPVTTVAAMREDV